MISLNRPLAVIYVLSLWTSEYAAGCKDRQTEINGRCCDQCPPGTYLKEFCSEHKQTVCIPCQEGYFSDTYSTFDRCEKCLSCQQEYAAKCTPTTNANCSCCSGFLCSDNVCSKCEENKCVIGEKPMRTEIKTKYSYQCKPACPDTEYYDAKMDICKPQTQCNALGLRELFPGNKTHDSICDRKEIPDDGGFFQVSLGICFVLLSLTLLVVAFYTCTKILRKHKANNNPIDIVAVSTNTCDFHLSKEESGLQLINQSINNMEPLHMERVNTF